MTEKAQNPGVESNPAEDQTMSREMALAEHLEFLLQVFSTRQSEVLRISEFVQAREAELHDAKMRAKRAIEQQLVDVDDDLLEQLVELFQSSETDENGLPKAERLDALQAAFSEVAAELPPGTEQTYVESILSSLRPAVGVEFLYASLLTTLVAELEMFVNQLARVAFEYNPEKLMASEKTYTFAQISAYGSFDELRDGLVDSTVEDVLRGSLTEWLEFFERRFELPTIESGREIGPLEAIQRRNCVIHNGGLVNKIYLDKLAEFKVSAKIDEKLDIDAKYLSETADSLFLVAYSLTWALADKSIKEKEAHQAAIGNLTNRTMYLVQEGRCDLVKEIGKTAPHSALMRNPDYHDFSWILTINRWLAYKELGQFDRVRQQVEEFSVRSKDDRFKMAKAALLDQVDDAVRFAKILMEKDELKHAHVLTWPLLREIRDHAHWAK